MSRLYFDDPCWNLADWVQHSRCLGVIGDDGVVRVMGKPCAPIDGPLEHRIWAYLQLNSTGLPGTLTLAGVVAFNRRQREAWRAYQHQAYRELQADRARRKVRLSRMAPYELRKAILVPGVQCTYCGTTEKVGIDHMTPICQDGGNEPWNLAPACFTCNEDKGGRTVEQWLRGDPLPAPLKRKTPMPRKPPRWEVLVWLGTQLADEAA